MRSLIIFTLFFSLNSSFATTYQVLDKNTECEDQLEKLKKQMKKIHELDSYSLETREPTTQLIKEIHTLLKNLINDTKEPSEESLIEIQRKMEELEKFLKLIESKNDRVEEKREKLIEKTDTKLPEIKEICEGSIEHETIILVIETQLLLHKTSITIEDSLLHLINFQRIFNTLTQRIP